MSKIKCPRFGCNGVGIPADTKKKFSVSKSLTGGLLGFAVGGPIGSAVGASVNGIKGKNGKTIFVCSKCGKVFEKKL